MKRKSAKKLYSAFHGRPGGKEYTVDIGDLSNVVDLGKGIAIEYEAIKEHLGDNDYEIYRHEFEKPCRLYWTGKALIIAGKSLQVTERGILN